MTSPAPTNCLFCRIVRGEIPATKVYEDDQVLAFRDIAPAAPTHILVIPREHLENVAALDSAHDTLTAQLIRVANQVAAQEGLTENGYRLVTNSGRDGGQSVYHLHFHVLGGRAMAWPPG